MSYLYHIVSKDFNPNDSKSSKLYPLNRLKLLHPEIYASNSQKYTDRKHVQELYIPQFDCYWGDVVHFSAVQPTRIVDVLASFNQKKQFSYFEIDPHTLEPSKTIVYTNRPREDMKIITEADFKPFDPDTLDQWDYIPPETLAYYERNFAEGRQPKLFVFIPHILYKGVVDLSGLQMKSTSETKT